MTVTRHWESAIGARPTTWVQRHRRPTLGLPRPRAAAESSLYGGEAVVLLARVGRLRPGLARRGLPRRGEDRAGSLDMRWHATARWNMRRDPDPGHSRHDMRSAG